MQKSIGQQIKDSPKLHFNLFTCWGFAIIFFLCGKFDTAFIFVAVSFVISGLIDTVTILKGEG